MWKTDSVRQWHEEKQLSEHSGPGFILAEALWNYFITVYVAVVLTTETLTATTSVWCDTETDIKRTGNRAELTLILNAALQQVTESFFF